MKQMLMIFCFLSFSLLGYGQQKIEIEENKKAILYLKNGSELEVSVIDWNEELGIKVTTIWGQEMFFPASKIKMLKAITKASNTSFYVFRENDIYYSLTAGIIPGNNSLRTSGRNGYTASFSSGYRFHRLLCLGVGTSVDQYAYNSGERMHPIFLDLRSYFFPKNSTFVLNLQTGYSLAFKNENKGIVDAKGGFMFYPSLGISFGRSDIKYAFDIGYKFQQATWKYGNQWDSRSSIEYDLLYQRLVLRFGIVI
jgi:hypothetical protein